MSAVASSSVIDNPNPFPTNQPPNIPSPNHLPRMKIYKGDRPAISEAPDTAEVYEWFGAASFAAQVLEQGILVALVVLDSRCQRVSEEEWDSF